MSRVIKSHQTVSNDSKKVIQLRSLASNDTKSEIFESNVEDLAIEAEKLVDKAKLQAEQIRAEADKSLLLTKETIERLKLEWETERMDLVESARKEGYNIGYEQSVKEVNDKYSGILKEASQIVDQAKLHFNEQMEQSEEIILKLGIKMAEKILQVHLDEKKEDFVNIVKFAIKEVKDYTDISIIVHPNMYEMVLLQKEELLALFNREKNLFIYPNKDLNKTSCIIESPFGRIDASIDSQLTVLKEKLLELL